MCWSLGGAPRLFWMSTWWLRLCDHLTESEWEDFHLSPMSCDNLYPMQCMSLSNELSRSISPVFTGLIIAEYADGGSDLIECARCRVVNAIEAAFERVCNKCKVRFLKNNGCNKIYCANCGNVQCYLCSQSITDYSHFGNPPRCHLWDSEAQILEQKVRARDAKIEEILKHNPRLKREDLLVEVDWDAGVFCSFYEYSWINTVAKWLITSSMICLSETPGIHILNCGEISESLFPLSLSMNIFLSHDLITGHDSWHSTDEIPDQTRIRPRVPFIALSFWAPLCLVDWASDAIQGATLGIKKEKFATHSPLQFPVKWRQER